MKTGILLINLGTPAQPDPTSVRHYLREFLNDPRVIDLPKLIRWVLVNLIVIPRRYKQSAAAYQKIWGKSGSPLLINSEKLATALAAELGEQYHVVLGMRYGKPSIAAALKQLTHCKTITVIPLFPQYASAATGSAIEVVLKELAGQWNIPSLNIINDFYQDANFIAAYADIIQRNMANQTIDQLLFSFHGLPERHITKSDCKALCDHQAACPAINNTNAYCYRAQCYKTAALLAEKLRLPPHQYTVAFQSRLGRTPWIKPYADWVLPELRQKGMTKIAVVCPSFVADCLETLEEVNIRMREQWLSIGGEAFTFIPCLNDHEVWVKGLGQLARCTD